jgi:hypothetical protein
MKKIMLITFLLLVINIYASDTKNSYFEERVFPETILEAKRPMRFNIEYEIFYNYIMKAMSIANNSKDYYSFNESLSHYMESIPLHKKKLIIQDYLDFSRNYPFYFQALKSNYFVGERGYTTFCLASIRKLNNENNIVEPTVFKSACLRRTVVTILTDSLECKKYRVGTLTAYKIRFRARIEEIIGYSKNNKPFIPYEVDLYCYRGTPVSSTIPKKGDKLFVVFLTNNNFNAFALQNSSIIIDNNFMVRQYSSGQLESLQNVYPFPIGEKGIPIEYFKKQMEYLFIED